MPRTPQPIEIEQVFNPDPLEGHRLHLAALKVLVDIILDNDAKYGPPEKVDNKVVA